MALSIFVMLLSVAAGKGMQAKIREKISAFSGHILVLPYNNNHSRLTLEPISLHQDFYEHPSAYPSIKHIAPYATIGGLLSNRKDFEGIILKGVGPDYDWSVFKTYLKKGRIPRFTDSVYNDSILISAYLASRLRLDTGSPVRAYFLRKDSGKPLVRRFKVAGIYQTDFEDFDKTYIWGDLRHVRRLYAWSDTLTGGFEIITPSWDHIDEETRRLNHSIDPQLRALSIKQLNPYLFDWLDMFDFNIYLIIGILMVVVALNMSVMLLVLIIERTSFIGVMKTLGARDRSIVGIFLLLAARIMAAGLLIGNVLALAVILLQQKTGFLTLNPETYYVRRVPLEIDFLYWIKLNVFVLLIILVVLILPAAYILRISPARVVKYE
ncbi:MAG: ABC transporter permease [Chlorobi bacterium]|nr:ABC transporter permease [Chlorobiota bacterium]